MPAFEADDWARSETMPSEGEIRRNRRLIGQVKADLDDLSAEERPQVEEAVAVVRRGRVVMLGMPRVGQPIPPCQALEAAMIPAMRDGRHADTGRRRQKVAAAVKNAAKNGTPISISAIARQAGADRSFLPVTATDSKSSMPPNSKQQPRTRLAARR